MLINALFAVVLLIWCATRIGWELTAIVIFVYGVVVLLAYWSLGTLPEAVWI